MFARYLSVAFLLYPIIVLVTAISAVLAAPIIVAMGYSLLSLACFLLIYIYHFRLTHIRLLTLFWLFSGILLQFIISDIYRDVYQFGIFNAPTVGRFNFSSYQYYELFLASATGCVSVIGGLLYGEEISKRLPSRIKGSGYFFLRSPLLWFYIVSGFYVILMAIAFTYGLAIMTKPIDRSFGFPLVGAITYTRNIVFPILLAILLQSTFNQYGSIRRGQVVILLFLTVVFVMTAASKKGIMFLLIPLLIWYFLYRPISLKLLIAAFVSLVIVFPLLTFFLDIVRFTHYQNIPLTLDLISYYSNSKEFDALSFMSLVLKRQVGLTELMSVIGIDDARSVELFLKRENLNELLYGFHFSNQVKANAVSLFGFFFLSDSYIILSVGVFIVYFVLSVISSVFTKPHNSIVGTYLSSIMFFDVFGGAVARFFSITVPTVLIILVAYDIYHRISFDSFSTKSWGYRNVC